MRAGVGLGIQIIACYGPASIAQALSGHCPQDALLASQPFQPKPLSVGLVQFLNGDRRHTGAAGIDMGSRVCFSAASP